MEVHGVPLRRATNDHSERKVHHPENAQRRGHGRDRKGLSFEEAKRGRGVLGMIVFKTLAGFVFGLLTGIFCLLTLPIIGALGCASDNDWPWDVVVDEDPE